MYREKEICYKELLIPLWKLLSLKTCSWQAGDPGELIGIVWPEFKGLKPRRANSIFFPKSCKLKTQEELLFQFILESIKKTVNPA